MHATIYARFSSELQDVRSITDQIAAARKYIETRGLTLTQTYQDAAISGASTPNRLGLQNLLVDALVGRFNIIVTKSLDRLSRMVERHGNIGGGDMKQRRISSSPLMDPTVCALVIITPDPQDLVVADPLLRTGYRRASAVVTKAAAIINVPVFTLSRQAKNQKPSRSASAPGISLHRQFIFEEHVSAWSGAFVDALAAEDRSILILAGYWLEHQILATALHALAESYDVCVLLDATPPRYPHASQPARDRLNQAGATPVVASQVIHEWTIETSDAAKRSALDSLSSALMLGG